MMNRKSLFRVAAALIAASGCCSTDVFTVTRRSGQIVGLYAPWDSLEDSTVITFRTDRDFFHFSFSIADSTITLCEPFTKETDVNPEDRAEVFFSPTPDMSKPYYCAEIDPLGRIMDYKATFPSILDYDWNFRTLEAVGEITPEGYRIVGKVSKRELEELGIDLRNGFMLGFYRADFHSDGSVIWYSRVKTDDETPFFHKPDMQFRAIMK